ncbi:MAG: U32 family peptidase, partial [Bacteriovoracaceae bacterium]|nr:U32 family peptidase [Bacteriovoracaceae bacterium]
DMGSAQFIKQHFSDKKIQLILENAHHNLKSILTQCDYWGKQLERVILSLELPQEILGQYVKSIHERGVQTEILSLGRILLFYSPRKLLSPLEISQEQFAASEESPHKGFPVIQNSHGTFMFHTKDFFLMDKISELDSMGMDFVRIDLRFGKDKSLLKLLANPQELKEQYPVSTMQSFFRSNQTDKIFSRLKNSHTQRLDAFFVGVVLDGDPAEPLYILVKNHKINLQLGQTLHVITPQGKEKNIVLDFMQNTQGEKLQKLEGERILLIPRKGAIPAGSAIYVEQIK